MKTNIKWTFIGCLIVAWTIGRPGACPAVEDAIIAVVGEELITLKDLNDYAQSTYVGLVTNGASEEEIKAVMGTIETDGINKLIEEKLILNKANQIGLKVREALVDERIAEITKKYGSEQKLTDALVRNGATLSDLRKKIRDDLKLKYVIDHQVKSKIYVNPQEVTEYYTQHKDRFEEKERVNLESIFIKFDVAKETAAAKAQEALAQINKGRLFAEVAQEFSGTPSVGIVKREQLKPEIENIVFNLQPDQVSPMVETETGIFIFKLVGKVPAKIANLEDVKGMIHSLLFKEKFRQRFADWLEQLKEDAYIEIK